MGAKADRVVSVASTQDGKTAVVPAGASAVAYNITVVRPDGPGHLRVMPGDVPPPRRPQQSTGLVRGV